MTHMYSISVGVEIEPIVKLTCLNVACRFNNTRFGTCNLKEMYIAADGQCGMFEPEKKPANEGAST